MMVQWRQHFAARSGKSVGGVLRAIGSCGWDSNRMVRIESKIIDDARQGNNAKAF
jgi:hypothetical protein